jgi:hypothetical protein
VPDVALPNVIELAVPAALNVSAPPLNVAVPNEHPVNGLAPDTAIWPWAVPVPQGAPAIICPLEFVAKAAALTGNAAPFVPVTVSVPVAPSVPSPDSVTPSSAPVNEFRI